MIRMGTNVIVKENNKHTDVSAERMKLERDLRSCMQCKFFHNGSLCAKYKCVEEEEQKKQPERPAKCIGCPYLINEQICFPCMRKMLGQTE